ncbi:DUF5776 domain-containing protein [Levilactobacillus sp. HBUAS70063]|uniref:DUF5776 domain-containing protein n=1 Tax=Levilactobacillus sp. HBUAS70063 TaxID=3109359 RepID=UPI0031332A8C
MPYSLSATSAGAIRRYWLTKAPHTLTLTQLNDEHYMKNLVAPYPEDDPLREVAGTIPNRLSNFWGTTIKLDATTTLLDYWYPRMGMGENLPFKNKAAAANYIVNLVAYMAYNTRDLAQYKLGVMNFKQLQQDYFNHIRPLANALGNTTDLADAFSSEKNFICAQLLESTLNPQMLTHFGYSGLALPELSQLDPESTEKLVRDALRKPFTDYLVKQADGTYFLSGLILPDGIVSLYSLGGLPPVPSPTSPVSSSQPVTIHYIDEQGKSLRPDQTLTGILGTHYQTKPLNITGYTLAKTTGEETGTFSPTAKSVTYTYAAATNDTNDDAVNPIAPKGSVIYATKKIGLYQHATFTKQTRKQWYAKKSRINRPMFVVTGYAKSKNGVERYRVKDVNHHSKTAGQTGYVTANAKYTSRVYYATKQKTITVINPKGVNAYGKKNLTNKKAHYRQGQVLKVKKIVRQNLTTRFVLSNGRYVTANKLLVKTGKQTMPKRVQAKTALNRYDTVNLTKRNKHYTKKSHATFKVKGWKYSNAHDFSKGDTLRYQVAGGYISGNRQFVSILK